LKKLSQKQKLRYEKSKKEKSMKKILQHFFLFLFSFSIVVSIFLVSAYYPKSLNQIPQKKIFLSKYLSKNEDLIRVQIIIYDNTKKEYNDIVKVTFNNQNIILQTADTNGKRAIKYYQLPPGDYKLKWKVSKSDFAWPRSKSFEKNIELQKTDKYVFIMINGDQITISSS
jgi:hypothetical protein